MQDEGVSASGGRRALAPNGVMRKVLGVVLIVVIVAAGLALAYLGKGLEDPWLGSVIRLPWGAVTIVETVAALSFLIQFVAYVPAYVFQTEKFYDLTGSVTYLTCVWYSYAAGMRAMPEAGVRLRPTVTSCLVSIWALRLGSFLFRRVLEDNGDSRFTEIKPNAVRFLVAWTLQGLWVFLTAFAVFVINASTADSSLGVVDCVGIAVWALNFAVEVVADRQKSWWRKQPENKGKFIEYGLWYYSRHPNYAGEVLLWLGIFIIGAASLQGTQWVTVISPIFVFSLIYFVSGVPMLEKKADQRWGGQRDYDNYKATTSVFFILPKLGKRVQEPLEAP